MINTENIEIYMHLVSCPNCFEICRARACLYLFYMDKSLNNPDKHKPIGSLVMKGISVQELIK